MRRFVCIALSMCAERWRMLLGLVAMSTLVLYASAAASQNVSPLLLSDSQIDSIKDVGQAKRILKQYAEYIRSLPNAGNEQRIADEANMHQQRMAYLQQSLAVITLAKVVADNANTQAEVEKAQVQAASDCHDLANVQTALTGGLALNPAAYGRTYLGIAGLISPFFFPKCASGHPISPQGNQSIRETLDSLSSQLKAQLQMESALR